jgi:hypothetical protein
MVDQSGFTIANPSFDFENLLFSFDHQDSHAEFSTSSQRMRVYNPTTNETWTANLSGSAPGAQWVSGSNTYDFNDSTGSGYTNGQMTFDPSSGTISGVSGCSTSNISKGNSDSFVQASVDSIDIMTASAGAATSCRWDFLGSADNITQKIPASQAVGNYSITMLLTIQ